MTIYNSRFNVLPAPRLDYAAQKLNHLQTDLVSTARMWAVDEVGAAMAHQLNEPLTALLLYLHGIKQEGEHFDGTEAKTIALRDLIEKAIGETQRVCDIMERLGYTVEAPPDVETAVARGREAINSWKRGSGAKARGYGSAAAPRSNQRGLTPREREVLALITSGSSNKEGGHRLGISTRTFEVHRAHIMEKLGAKNAADLVRMTLSEIG